MTLRFGVVVRFLDGAVVATCLVAVAGARGLDDGVDFRVFAVAVAFLACAGLAVLRWEARGSCTGLAGFVKAGFFSLVFGIEVFVSGLTRPSIYFTTSSKV